MLEHPNARVRPTIAPTVRIVPAPGSGLDLDEAIFSARLLSFTYEDTDDDPPEVRLEFEAASGSLVRTETLALGLDLQISWGYPDSKAIRDVTIRTVAGIGSGSGGSKIEYVGRPTKLDRLHQNAGPALAGLPVFENMTASAVAREIAGLVDLTGASTLIEDTEQVYPLLAMRSNETPFQFMRRLAKLHNFTWGVSQSTFHFHSRGFQPPPAVALLASGGPDVLEWKVEGDLTVYSPSEVTVKGYDPKERHVIVSEHRPEGPVAVAMIDIGPFSAGAPAVGGARQNLVARETISTGDARNKAGLKAARLLRARADRQWKLNLRTIGYPDIMARTWIDFAGAGGWVDGRWYVRGVKHTIDGGGYITEILEATRRGAGAAAAPLEHGDVSETRPDGQTVVSGYNRIPGAAGR